MNQEMDVITQVEEFLEQNNKNRPSKRPRSKSRLIAGATAGVLAVSGAVALAPTVIKGINDYFTNEQVADQNRRNQEQADLENKAAQNLHSLGLDHTIPLANVPFIRKNTDVQNPLGTVTVAWPSQVKPNTIYLTSFNENQVEFHLEPGTAGPTVQFTFTAHTAAYDLSTSMNDQGAVESHYPRVIINIDQKDFDKMYEDAGAQPQ